MIFTALQILEKRQKYATMENGKISRNVPGQEANTGTPRMKEDRINENNKRKITYLNPENKLLIYKVIRESIWTYGIELRGTSADSIIKKIGSMQSIIHDTVVNGSRYVRNDDLRKILGMKTVRGEMECSANK